MYSRCYSYNTYVYYMYFGVWNLIDNHISYYICIYIYIYLYIYIYIIHILYMLIAGYGKGPNFLTTVTKNWLVSEALTIDEMGRNIINSKMNG